MTPALVKEIGGKLYPDLTHQFIVALTSHARNLRCNAYSKGAFDGAVRSVVALGLFLRPLRSPEAAKRLKGVGSQVSVHMRRWSFFFTCRWNSRRRFCPPSLVPP